jgi:uncharacterized protein YjdB
MRPTAKVIASAARIATALCVIISCSTQRIADELGEPQISITLSPATFAMVVGEVRTVIATVTPSSAGTPSWSSSNETIATISSSGVVTARAPGTTRIAASLGSVAGAADLTVATTPPPPPPPPAPVASVTVAPSTASVQVGSTVQLAATLRDASGNVLTGRTTTWSSANTGIATVSGTGLVTGQGAGPVNVSATSEGRSGSAAITVTAVPPPPPAPVASVTVAPSTASVQVGSTVQLTATLRDASGNVLTGRTTTWSSANTGIATVSGTGLVTGQGAGPVNVSATSEGRSGSAAITVTAVPPPPPPPPGCTAPTILSHGFDNQQWAPLQNGGEGSYIAADATARGGYAVRKDWRGGSFDGGTVRAEFAPQKRVYARWRFKYDARFDVNGIFKMIRFQDPNIGPLNGTMNIQWGRFVWFWDTQSVAYYQNVGAEISPQSLKDSWHWFEVMNDISIDGSPRARVWIDGVLKIDAVGSGTAPTNGKTFGSVQWTGTYNDPAATATSWVDDVALSINCIGVPQ